jgi:hypothetical protein
MNVSIERLEQIEKERAKIFSDPNFIKWVRELRVSCLAINHVSMEQTRRAMKNYNYKNYKINLVA